MPNHPVVHLLSQALNLPANQERLRAPLYLACSGGRDSLALAWACHQLHQAGNLPTLPVLLHVHHGWQAANDDWARLVENWASEHGFACQILSVQLDKHNEKAARQARYRAFLSVMPTGSVLMLAHHATDQAETVLMRLLSGAGVAGLSAMKTWQAYQGQADQQIWLWRPWLGAMREQIGDFAHAHRLPYVDDATNLDERLMRGYLRQQILPKLTQINPSAIANIARSAQLCQQAATTLDEHLAVYDSWVQDEASQAPYQQVLNTDQLARLPGHAQESVIHRWLGRGEPLAPSQALTWQVLQLARRADNTHQTQIFWQGERRAFVVCAYDGRLYRYWQEAWELLQATGSQPAPVSLPKITHQGLALAQHQALSVLWQAPDLPASAAFTVRPISAQESLTIGRHRYRGKKLYQHLRLPTWLRGHLWQLVIDHEGLREEWLLAPRWAHRVSDASPILDDRMPLPSWQGGGDDVQ